MQLSACPCPTHIEQTANNYSLVVDPFKYPNGTPLHSSQNFECRSIWINVQRDQTRSAYLGFSSAEVGAGCIEIAPGDKEFFTIIDEMEKLVAIPALRFKPYNWKLNASGVMTVSVMVFL